MQPILRKMCADDLEQAVQTHILAFPDSRSTSLGKTYIRRMFQWFLSQQAGLCLVADLEGEVVGYVIGAIGGYGRRLFVYALPQIAWGLLTHPALWLKPKTFALWHSYLQALNPARLIRQGPVTTPPQDNHTPIIKASLAGIAVKPTARGKGIAHLLVKAFETAMLEQGATRLGLSVEINNTTARQLYEAHGWFEDSLSLETQSVHYTKFLDPES